MCLAEKPLVPSASMPLIMAEPRWPAPKNPMVVAMCIVYPDNLAAQIDLYRQDLVGTLRIDVVIHHNRFGFVITAVGVGCPQADIG